jgi:hypothetical protein
MSFELRLVLAIIVWSLVIGATFPAVENWHVVH